MRPLWLFAGVVVLSVQLYACAKVRQVLPPAQVLERATVAGTQLESARFALAVDWTDGDGSLVVQADGVMQNGGKQLGASFTGAYVPSSGTATEPIEAAGEVRLVSGTEQYVRLHRLSILPEEAGLFLNTWWKLPTTESGHMLSVDVSPDPFMLSSQSQAVRVVRDDGIVHRDGEDVYHYAVSVDAEKLKTVLAAMNDEAKDEPLPEWLNSEQVEGELWIGADDFLLREARWLVRETTERPLPRGTLRIILDDINDAPAVSVPPNAPEFSFDAFGMPPSFLSPTP